MSIMQMVIVVIAGLPGLLSLAAAGSSPSVRRAAQQRPAYTLFPRAGHAQAQLPSTVELSCDSFVVIASRPCTITSALGNVVITRAAIVLVSWRDSCLRVVDLHDEQKNSVQIVVRGHVFYSYPGKQVLVVERLASSLDVLSDRSIGKRRVVGQQIADKWVIASEIDIIDLLKADPLLQSMRQRKDDREGARAVAKIIRTAACVAVALRAHGKYEKSVRTTGVTLSKSDPQYPQVSRQLGALDNGASD